MPIENDSSLPKEIVEAIAIGNAKSIGEQPAILANLALANQILNTNLQQQALILQQQAFNQITMATVARCVQLILSTEPNPARLQEVTESISQLQQMLVRFQESGQELLRSSTATLAASAAPAAATQSA